MRINHVTILVKNKKASEKFFTEVLGFPKKEIGKHLWIAIGDQYIHITENSGAPVPNTFYHFAIEIDNLSEYIVKIQARGADVLNDGTQYFLRDIDGNLIELIDEKNSFFK